MTVFAQALVSVSCNTLRDAKRSRTPPRPLQLLAGIFAPELALFFTKRIQLQELRIELKPLVGRAAECIHAHRAIVRHTAHELGD